MRVLGELSEKHVYFKLLYLQWFWRKSNGSIDPGMAEEMRQLPEQLLQYQKQAQKFVENILDVDRVDRDVQKNGRIMFSISPEMRNYFASNQSQPASDQWARATVVRFCIRIPSVI